MKKNDIFEAEIISAGSNGEGVCRINNLAVFVPYAVIGDVAEIRILKVNKSYAFGKIENIIKPSPSRVESNCLAFGKCGGCALQTTSYEKQLDIKRQKVKDALERIGGFSQIEVMPCVESNPCYEYRNKAQYPVADVNGVAETGFYAPRSHRLIKMDNCSLTDADSKIISKAIVDFANENNVKGYNEETKKGCIRHIYTRHGEKEIIVVIVGAEKNLKHKEKLVNVLLNLEIKREVVGIVYNYNPKPDNVILGDTHEILYGRSYIYDTLCGIKFKIDYKSFYQVNKATTEKLYSKAIELLDAKKDETVFDLYCGIGTITLCAAKNCKKIIGVEVVEEAIKDAKENALSNGIDNAEFYVGTAEDVCPKLIEDGFKPTAIIVDPPRKGCDKKLLETIVSLSPSRVVYVSCDPATLARDAKFLCDNGYKLTKAYPFDQFPHTGHVETVVCLSRQINVRKMKLNSTPFEMIKSGEKTIELRLYDEKRQQVKVGDKILFTNIANGETLNTTVIKLHRFDSFEELYKSLPLLKCGYTAENIEKATPSDMEQYYSVEEQKKYGVVGIELCRPKQITDESVVCHTHTFDN